MWFTRTFDWSGNTDPATLSLADFAAFCRTTGNELIESKQEGQTYSFLIKRAG